MSTQFEKLNNAVNLGLINMDDYYSVTVSKYSIKLQGMFASELVKKYGGKFETDTNGFLCTTVTLCDAKFEIVLTD